VGPLTENGLGETSDQELLLSEQMQDLDVDESVRQPEMLVVARLLWRKRKFVGQGALAGLLLFLALGLIRPNKYESTVQLMPPDTSSLSGSSAMMGAALSALGGKEMGGGSASAAGGFAGTVGDLLGVQKPGALFIGILRSRTISDRIIDRFDLRKVYSTRTYLRAEKKLLSRVTFEEEKKSGLLSITVIDHDKARATAMASAYIDELNKLLSEVNNSAASKERQFLGERLVTVNGELVSTEKELSQFSSKNATLDPSDQGKAMLDAAATLQGQLIAAKSELSGLEQIYTSENVRVRSLKAHIAELQQQVDSFSGKDYAGSTKLDSNALFPSLRQLPVLGQQYLDLYRRAKVDEVIFQLLTESYEMAKVQEAKDTPSVKVLDAPKLAERPSNWGALVLAPIGLVLGCVFCSVWVVADERWDREDPYRVFVAEILQNLSGTWTRVRPHLTHIKPWKLPLRHNGNQR
jgi:uncharacterized protein involved in exopolysaccharide biosynthesis